MIDDDSGAGAGAGFAAGFLAFFFAFFAGAAFFAAGFALAFFFVFFSAFFLAGAAFFAFLDFVAFFRFLAMSTSRSVQKFKPHKATASAAAFHPYSPTSTPRVQPARTSSVRPSCSGIGPPVAQSMSSTVWTTGMAVPDAI